MPLKLPHKKRDETSATITQTLWLVLVCSGLCAVTAYAADPSWWSTPGSGGTPSAVVEEQVVTSDGVVTTNYVPNPYAAVNQGQLKQFTARAVDHLNTYLPGGAGANLTTLVQGWHSDYQNNGQNSNDFKVMNLGQLKYIANLVDSQLTNAGYAGLYPIWLGSTNADTVVANLGQLKQAFDFDLSVAPNVVSNLIASTNIPGQIDLSWTLPPMNNATNLTVLESTNGGATWIPIVSLGPTNTSYVVSNPDSLQTYTFQVSNSNNSGSSTTSSPSSPTGLTGSYDNSGNMNLTWTASTGATSYLVERENLATGNWSTLGTPSGATYQDTGYGTGGYHYRVSAVNSTGSSAPSTEFPQSRYAIIDLGTNVAPIKVTNSGLVLNQSSTSYNLYGTNACFCWSKGMNLPINPQNAGDVIGVNDINESGTIVGFEINGDWWNNPSDENLQEGAQQWTLSGTNIVAGTPDYSLGGLVPNPNPAFDVFNEVWLMGFSSAANKVDNVLEVVPPSNNDWYYLSTLDWGRSFYANDFIDGTGNVWCTALTWADGNSYGYADAGKNKVELGSLTPVLFELTDSWVSAIILPSGTDDRVLGVNNSGSSIMEQNTFTANQDSANDELGSSWISSSTNNYVLNAGATSVPLSFIPAGLNNAGAVVGRSSAGTTGIWYDTNGVTHTLPFGLPSRINAATNSDGTPAYEAIGIATFGFNALVWDMGSTNSFNPPQALEDLIPASSGWTNIAAASINDGGAIVGTATYSGTNTAIPAGPHGVMLLPMQIVTQQADGTEVPVGQTIPCCNAQPMITGLSANSVSVSSSGSVSLTLSGQVNDPIESISSPDSSVTKAVDFDVSYMDHAQNDLTRVDLGSTTLTAVQTSQDEIWKPYGSGIFSFSQNLSFSVSNAGRYEIDVTYSNRLGYLTSATVIVTIDIDGSVHNGTWTTLQLSSPSPPATTLQGELSLYTNGTGTSPTTWALAQTNSANSYVLSGESGTTTASMDCSDLINTDGTFKSGSVGLSLASNGTTQALQGSLTLSSSNPDNFQGYLINPNNSPLGLILATVDVETDDDLSADYKPILIKFPSGIQNMLKGIKINGQEYDLNVVNGEAVPVDANGNTCVFLFAQNQGSNATPTNVLNLDQFNLTFVYK